MNELIKLYCQNCGAELEISSDREFCYCTYCGKKTLIPGDRKFIHIKKDINVNSVFTNKIIDEAKVTKEQEKTKRSSTIAEMFTNIICAIGIIILLIAFMLWSKR